MTAVSTLAAAITGTAGTVGSAFAQDDADVESLVDEMRLDQKVLRTHGEAALNPSLIAEAGAAIVRAVEGWKVDVTNTGDHDGAETVQVYVGEVDPPVERPPKELKGFAKADGPAGATETVTIDLGRDAFQYRDPDEEDWVVDGGTYRILVGASSRTIRPEARVRVRTDRGRGQGGGPGRGN